MRNVEHLPHDVTLDSDAVVMPLRSVATADELENESLADFLLTISTLQERMAIYRRENPSETPKYRRIAHGLGLLAVRSEPAF